MEISMSIYDTLNEQQREAVFHTEGPVLILAGAGSGKTRVLTHRTAYLIEEKGVNPYNIMAITFTNKAAGEMRERIDQLVGYGSESIWVSTFHSTCVRILRRHIDRIGFDTNFTIYDSDDQKTLMKDICKRLNVDTKIYKERSLLAAISKAKDELVDPQEFSLRAAASGDFAKRKQAEIYREYQDALRRNNALDFDDLIVKTVELFKTDAQVLDYYQERFRYIMVDEYQDTNTAQFELIRLLAGKYQNLCVVGDDDQSIYKFRGANIYNILNFEKHFPDAKTIKLEQNYRSTQNILNAANSVIANNVGRKSKTLWTANDELANMSHEIRTPLNAIVGFSDLLSDTSNFTEEEVTQFIATINKNCGLLLALINDILDLSRIESGTMEFMFAEHNLPLLLKTVHDSQRLNMPAGVELVLRMLAGDKKYLTTDNVRLQQVVNNLINNAAKFTGSGFITFGYEEDEEPGYTRIFVEDTGVGISEEGIRHIFERFYKVDNFTQGAGLGLSICQTIVERLKGTISVTSEVGKGTRFTVRLPNYCE